VDTRSEVKEKDMTDKIMCECGAGPMTKHHVWSHKKNSNQHKEWEERNSKSDSERMNESIEAIELLHSKYDISNDKNGELVIIPKEIKPFSTGVVHSPPVSKRRHRNMQRWLSAQTKCEHKDGWYITLETEDSVIYACKECHVRKSEKVKK